MIANALQMAAFDSHFDSIAWLQRQQCSAYTKIKLISCNSFADVMFYVHVSCAMCAHRIRKKKIVLASIKAC